MYFGYYNAIIRLSRWSITNYIIPITVIIISTEIIRNILVAQNTKPTKIITFIIMVLVDLIVYANVYDINNYQTFLEVVGFTLFASISCNLMYNYVSARYSSIPIIIYRLITILYVYFIPIIPNVYMFFRCILRTIYPYLVYLLLEFTFGKKNVTVAYTEKRKAVIFKILLIIAALIVAALVSCEFKYGVLVIGSGSMTGTIDKGDALIFEKYDGESHIEEGQIVMFNQDNIQVVHRVINVKNVNGTQRYFTKGDANDQEDEGYITKNDIAGLYVAKVKYVGYPSLWLRDLFAY